MSTASEVPLRIQPKCFCICYNMLVWRNIFKADAPPINNKPYYCGRCEKGFSPDDNVTVHNLLHTLNILKNFHIFDKDAISKMYLTTYNIIHADKKLRSFKEISNTKEYLSSEDVNVENCSMDDVSNASDSLQNNEKDNSIINTNLLKKNSKEYPFPCPLCDKSFKHKSELSVHISIHVKKDPHNCIQCGSVFKHEIDLVSHMESHDKEIPYCCGLCSKLFTRKPSLIAHIRNHFDEKSATQYACKVCENIFICKKDVIKHLSVHAIKSPCDKCEKLYKLKNGFGFYYCSHTFGKRYACITCSKRFEKQRGLKKHLLTHSEERPYACILCKKAYTQKRSLYAHYTRHPKHNIPLAVSAEADTTDVIVQATNVTFQVTDVTVQATDLTVQATDVIVPNTDVIVPNTDVIVPNTDVIVPNTDVIVQVTDVIVQATDVIVPTTDVIDPDTDNFLPKDAEKNIIMNT